MAAPPGPFTGTMLPRTGTMPPGSMQGFNPGQPGPHQDYRTMPPGSMNAPPQYQTMLPGSINLPRSNSGHFGQTMLPGSQPLSMPPGSMPLGPPGSMPFGGSMPPRTMIPPPSEGPTYEVAAR